MASKKNASFKSFFSVVNASGAGSNLPSRASSSGSLAHLCTPPKPGWVGAAQEHAASAPGSTGFSAPSSRRPSFSEENEDGMTPPRTPPLRRQTTVPAEDRVKVVVRLRPAQDHETGGAMQVSEDGKDVQLLRTKVAMPSSEFYFDEVLGPQAGQADVYQAAVAPVVADVLKGYNGTVLAYGQTGAGKTFTLGSLEPDNIGMMPRAAAAIFAGIKGDVSHHFTVHMSYLQIYMELIQDLLNPKAGDLQLRENAEDGVHVPGMKEVLVTRLEDCLELLKVGERNRSYAFTKMNAHSSRSHAIVILTVAKRRVVDPNVQGIDAVSKKANVGHLFMVDLAGSERLKKSLSVGVRANEAKAINLSLTVLGMCINARASNVPVHVPYRDSKLTRLLKESLGGNARTTLVIAVADALEHCEETQQSLAFGMRAMFVENQAVVNEKTDDEATHRRLMLEMAEQADKADELGRMMIAKESELGVLENRLEDEKQQREAIMLALERERQAAVDEQRRAAEAHLAELEAERLRQEALAQQLSRTEAETMKLASKHAEERAALQAALQARDADFTAVQRAAEEADAARAALERQGRDLQERLTAELEGVSKKTAAEVTALEQQLQTVTAQLEEAQTAAADAAKQAAEQKDALLAKAASERSRHEAQLEEVRGEVSQLRGQLAAAEGAASSASAEVERLRDLGAQLRTRHSSEQDTLNAEICELRTQLDAARSSAEQSAAEVTELKTSLMAERSAGSKQAAAHQAEVTGLREAVEAGQKAAADQAAEHRAAVSQLREELAAQQEAATEHASALHAEGSSLREKLAAEQQAAAEQAAAQQSEIDRLREKLAAQQASATEHATSLQAENSGLREQLASEQRGAAEQAAAHQSEMSKLREESAAQQKSSTEHAARLETTSSKLREDLAAQQKSAAEQEAVHQAEVRGLREGLEAARSAAAAAAATAAAEAQELRSAAAAARAAATEQQRASETLTVELRSGKDALQKQVEQLMAEMKQAGTSAASLAASAASERAWLQSQMSELQASSKEAAKSAETTIAGLRDTAQRATTRNTQLTEKLEKEELQRTAAEEQVAALTSRLAASQDQHKTEAVALSAEVEDLKERLKQAQEVTEGYQEMHALESADLINQLHEAQALSNAMAEEMAETREEAAVVAQQRDVAEAEAQRLAVELEHLQAEWADDTAALKAQSAREAEVAAEVAEATAAVMAEKDRRLEEAAAASAEASANAAAAAEAAASKLADSERCLAESRATTEFLETEGMKLQTEAAAVADELVARNQALSSAIRALTAEHAATCATSAAGREELSRLQHAYDVLDHQARAAEQQSKHNEEQAVALQCQLDELTAKETKASAAAATAAASAAERAAQQELDIKCLSARSAELQERLRQQTQESKRQRQAGSAAAEAALQAALEEVRHHQHVATAAAEDAVAAEDRASAAEARAAAAEATLAAAETKLAEHTAEAQQAAERAAAAMVLQRRFRTRRAAQQAADAACRQQALEQAQAGREALERRHAEEAAATGHKDFAASLCLMQGAVDSILATFLLPERDLKAARAARTLPAFHISAAGASGGGGMGRTAAQQGRGPDLQLHRLTTDASALSSNTTSQPQGASSTVSAVSQDTHGSGVSVPSSPTASHASSQASAVHVRPPPPPPPASWPATPPSGASFRAAASVGEHLSPLAAGKPVSDHNRRHQQSPPSRQRSPSPSVASMCSGRSVGAGAPSGGRQGAVGHKMPHVRPVLGSRTSSQPLQERALARLSELQRHHRAEQHPEQLVSSFLQSSPGNPGASNIGGSSTGVSSGAAGTSGSVPGRRSASPQLPTSGSAPLGAPHLGPLRESVISAATAPPCKPEAIGFGHGLFKPEASVFVSQFASDAAPPSPRRNATWASRRLTKPAVRPTLAAVGQEQHSPLRLTLATLDVNQAPSPGAASKGDGSCQSPPSLSTPSLSHNKGTGFVSPVREGHDGPRRPGHRRGGSGGVGVGAGTPAGGDSGGWDHPARTDLNRSFSFSGCSELNQKQYG